MKQHYTDKQVAGIQNKEPLIMLVKIAELMEQLADLDTERR
jgi:hypothetical protein